MAFTLATSARGGVRSGLAAALGVGLGSLVWAMLTAAGLAALLAASEHAFIIIRVVGGSYFIFLAVRTILTPGALHESQGAAPMMSAFRSGALTNLFNPKVGLFFLAFLPSFANPGIGPVWLQTLTLGAVFTLSGVCVLAIVAFAAGSLRDRLARSRRMRIALNAAAATAFGALGLRMLLTRPQ
jgi:threonine/homoserine/homoserine lactone efflux protein